MIGIVAKKKDPNWEAIKAEYLRGGTSYRKLADKYGVSSRTIERRAKAESWGDACRQVVGKVSAELPGKVADVILSEVEEITRKHFELWGKGLARAELMLDAYRVDVDKSDPQNPKNVLKAIVETAKDLKEWASAVKAVTEGQRLAVGIPDPNKAAKADPNAAQDDDEEGIKHGVLILPMKDELPEPPADPNDQEEEGDGD